MNHPQIARYGYDLSREDAIVRAAQRGGRWGLTRDLASFPAIQVAQGGYQQGDNKVLQ